MEFKLEGLDEAMRRLGAMSPNITRELAATLYQAGEDVIGESKEHYVPVDLAVLKNSGHVQPPVIEGAEVSVTLGFGGAAKDYAVIQHERLDYKHRVGGPKYLELPLLAAVSSIRDALGAALRRAFNG